MLNNLCYVKLTYPLPDMVSFFLLLYFTTVIMGVLTVSVRRKDDVMCKRAG
jgi:hypothetical protein